MQHPNIVLLMCDDLGYGDTGFNGNDTIRTPCLDTLSLEGGRFTRFYAGAPVCSPTRGTCLTGRHYLRYGITHANTGRLPSQEITLAQICRESGYATGHFGKWHLGTLTTAERDSNRGGPEHSREYSPPWLHGFDTCFSTEAKVPTWDPMVTPDEQGPNGFRWGTPGTPFGTYYWNERGEKMTTGLDGDDSRVIVDRAEPFIRACAAGGRPFLAVIWFHTPHAPVVAGPDHRALYAGLSEDEQHYYGCVTAMDEQIGRVNRLLRELDLTENTVIWFCSDNGPEGREPLHGRNRGSTGGRRGRKRSLFDGGVGVPALVRWPGVVPAGAVYQAPCSTLDYLPTMAAALGYRMPDARPLDGIDLLPLLRDAAAARLVPIPYRFLDRFDAMAGSPTLAMIDNQLKYLTNLSADGSEDLCFDLLEDPGETRNVLDAHRSRASEMRDRLRGFVDSCRHSHAGGDYPEPCPPLDAFQEPDGGWR